MCRYIIECVFSYIYHAIRRRVMSDIRLLKIFIVVFVSSYISCGLLMLYSIRDHISHADEVAAYNSAVRFYAVMMLIFMAAASMLISMAVDSGR